MTLEKPGVWLNPQWVSSNPERQAATLPLLQRFCVTPGMPFYRRPRQQLARFHFGQSPLRSWGTDRSPARAQGKAAHRKHLSHSCSLGGKDPHCTLKQREPPSPGFPARGSAEQEPESLPPRSRSAPLPSHPGAAAAPTVTAAEELSRDMERAEVQGLLSLASKCAAPEQPSALHCMQSEQQGGGAALGPRTAPAAWLQAVPRHQGRISKRTAANSRAGTEVAGPCSPWSATSPHRVAVLPAL